VVLRINKKAEKRVNNREHVFKAFLVNELSDNMFPNMNDEPFVRLDPKSFNLGVPHLKICTPQPFKKYERILEHS